MAPLRSSNVIRQLPDTVSLHSFRRSPDNRWTRHPGAASRMKPSMVSAMASATRIPHTRSSRSCFSSRDDYARICTVLPCRMKVLQPPDRPGCAFPVLGQRATPDRSTRQALWPCMHFPDPRCGNHHTRKGGIAHWHGPSVCHLSYVVYFPGRSRKPGFVRLTSHPIMAVLITQDDLRRGDGGNCPGQYHREHPDMRSSRSSRNAVAMRPLKKKDPDGSPVFPSDDWEIPVAGRGVRGRHCRHDPVPGMLPDVLWRLLR